MCASAIPQADPSSENSSKAPRTRATPRSVSEEDEEEHNSAPWCKTIGDVTIPGDQQILSKEI